MSLVTTADLRKYMSDITLSTSQDQAAQQALDGTQQQLESYLGRPVEPVMVREKVQSNDRGDLVLSVTPVHQVISLRQVSFYNFTELASPDITPLSDIEDSSVDRVFDSMPESLNVVPGGIYVGRGGVWFVVEYIGGYNGYVDDALKLSILEVASRTVSVNHDDTMSIKSMNSEDPAPQMNKGWKPEELAMFDRLRRRIAFR